METIPKTGPRWARLLVRFRWLVAYLLGSYGFWILGLPIWGPIILGFNPIEQLFFLVVFTLSPLTVPIALLFTTFVAYPKYDENVLTVIVVWALAVTSFLSVELPFIYQIKAEKPTSIWWVRQGWARVP